MDEEESGYIVATHVGKHHADELLGCAMLILLLGDGTRVVRTADDRVMALADFSVDVGRVHSPRHGRFDHHGVRGLPRDPTGRRPEGYAAAGLVWRTYGPAVIAACLSGLGGRAKAVCEAMDRETREELVGRIVDKIDFEMVVPIDRWDMGFHYNAYGKVLPFQWLLPNLEFEQALLAMIRALESRIVVLAMEDIGTALLQEDMLSGKGVEFYQFGEGTVLLCRVRAPDEPRLEWRAASAMARKHLEYELAALVVPVRKGERWAALLGNAYPYTEQGHPGIQISGSRKTLFADNPEILLGVLREAAESGSWLLTGGGGEDIVGACQGPPQ